MDEYDDIFTLEGDTQEAEQTQNQTPPQPPLGNGQTPESPETPSYKDEEDHERPNTPEQSPRTQTIVPPLDLSSAASSPEGEQTDRTTPKPPSSPRTIANPHSPASVASNIGKQSTKTIITPEPTSGKGSTLLETNVKEETPPSTPRPNESPEATPPNTARSEQTNPETTPQATPRGPETPRGEREVPSPTQLSTNEELVKQPAPPPPPTDGKHKERKTTLSWEEQYFQTLGEKTEENLKGKMSSRGDDKNQKPREKDKSKTYSRLNVSENTSELEALENRAKVIARSKDDYKTGQSIDKTKIELRQNAMTETTKALHEVLAGAPNQVKPEKGNGQFKIGPLSFNMDDNNNIDFPNELDDQPLTFKGSMSFVDADGNAMPKENRVYLGIAYEKGQISHIHTPGGLKKDDQGRAYIEIDNNRYYAKASYAKIQELEKAVDERREAKITELKAEKAEKVPEEQQTVASEQIRTPEDQSTNTKPLPGPPFEAAPYPPIAKRAPSPHPPLDQGTGKFWERVKEAQSKDEITTLANYINNPENAAEVNAGIDELNEEQAEALLRKLDEHYNPDNATAEDIGTMLDRLTAMSDANKAGFKNTIASLQAKLSPAEPAPEVAGPKDEELNKAQLNEDLLDAARRYDGSDEQKNAILYLIEEKGADVNAKDEWDYTPLMYVAATGHNIDFLLNAGADVNSVNENRDTALTIATNGRNNAQNVNLLIDKGANVNHANYDGKTALMYAAEAGNFEVVNLLIEQGADISLTNKQGKTALDIARSSENGQSNEVVILLERQDPQKRKRNDKPIVSPLFSAIAKNNHTAISDAIADRANVNEQYSNGLTPLTYALESSNATVVKALIDNGADVTFRDQNGSTPLMFAVRSGDKQKVQLLLEQPNINVNDNDNLSNTALIIAADKGNVEIVNILLEKGAEVNAVNGKSYTALTLAVENANPQIVQSLVKNHSVTSDHLNMALALNKKKKKELPPEPFFGTDKNQMEREARNEIREAIKDKKNSIKKNQKVMNGLDEATHGNRQSLNPLHAGGLPPVNATQTKTTNAFGRQGNGQEQERSFLKALNNTKANTKEINNQALIQAVNDNDIKRVNELLEKKADLSYQDRNGNTALHTAVENGNFKIVEALLKKEADPNKLNDNNKTAFNIAVERWNDASKQSNDTKIVELLCAHEHITAGTIEQVMEELASPKSSDTNAQKSYTNKIGILSNAYVSKNNLRVVSADLLKDRLSGNSQTTTNAQGTNEISPPSTPSTPRKSGTKKHGASK